MDGVDSGVRPSTGSGRGEALDGRDSAFGIRPEEAAAEIATSNEARSRRRVVIEHVWPEIDAGRFPIKRTSGEQVTVSADIFADGHDLLAGVVKYRRVPGPKGPGLLVAPAVGRVLSDPPAWQEVSLIARHDGRWDATFTVTELGEYEYTIEAWVDRFGSWLKDLVAKADADQDVSSELLEGAELIKQAVLPGPKGPGLPNPSSTSGGRVLSDPPLEDLRLLEI